MNARFKKYLKRGAVGVLIVAFGAIVVNNVANGATSAPVSITSVPVNSVGTLQLKDKAVTYNKLGMGSVWQGNVASPVWALISNSAPNSIPESALVPALRAKVNKLQIPGPQGPAGPAGPAGTAGADALLSVSKTINLTNRDDTATDGSVWAKDTLNRSFDVTRQHAAEASKCGATAVKCWYYTATIGDTGFFKTVDGAVTPNDSSKNISGIVNGTVLGVAEVEFYATSNTPDPSKVDATIAGGTSTTNMVKLFFDAGVTFGGLKLTDFSWTYDDTDPNQCNLHVQSMFGGNTGNITGTNQCTS